MTRTICGQLSWIASTCRSGSVLAKLAGSVFRIGHLGDLNDLSLLGTLAGVEMGLAVAEIPHEPAGVAAAMRYLEALRPDGVGGGRATHGPRSAPSTCRPYRPLQGRFTFEARGNDIHRG